MQIVKVPEVGTWICLAVECPECGVTTAHVYLAGTTETVECRCGYEEPLGWIRWDGSLEDIELN